MITPHDTLNGNLLVECSYVNRKGRIKKGQICIEHGMISEVGRNLGAPKLRYDCDKFTVFPGFIDLHVHAREYVLPPGHSKADVEKHRSMLEKETFLTASKTAMNGGVTAFALMPNDPFPPHDKASYDAKMKQAYDCCLVDFVDYALITKDSEPFSYEVPYKIYVHDFTDDELEEVLARYKGCHVTAHCEDKEIVEADFTRPWEAEVMSIKRMLDHAHRFGFSLHVAHLSTEGGIEDIIDARRTGIDVTCETTPAYVVLSHANFKESMCRNWLTIKPPLRSEQDRQRMLEGLRKGDIDCFATDHAPHTAKDKAVGIFGVPLLDHYTHAVGFLLQNGVKMKRVVEACCGFPGKFMQRFSKYRTGKEERFGRIEEGYVGSLNVVQELHGFGSIRTRNSEANFPLRTKCDWSPFEGMMLGDDYLLDSRDCIVRGVLHEVF